MLKGNLQVGTDPKAYPKHHTVVLSSLPGQNGVELSRPSQENEGEEVEEARFVLIAGEPLDQPVVQVSFDRLFFIGHCVDRKPDQCPRDKRERTYR